MRTPILLLLGLVLLALAHDAALAETDFCRMHGIGCTADDYARATRVYAWRKTERPVQRRTIRIEREREIEREQRREAREFGFLPVPSRNATCLSPVAVVGSQHVTENGAEESARKGWAEQVRFAHGEQFMDPDSSRDYAKRCTRSSIGELAGATMHRCQIVARPCRPALSVKEDGK